MKFKLIGIAFLTAGVAWASVPVNTQGKRDFVSVKPEPFEREAVQISQRFLNYYHYSPQKLNDSFSSDILDAYVESLDPNKSFFMQSDLASMEAYRDQLDDAISTAELTPPFAIFNLFVQRVKERIKSANKALNKPMDFSIDETYVYDRSESDWAKNESELDEIWRKRVKNDYLNLKLTDKAEEDIKPLLEKRYNNLHKRIADLDSARVFQLFMNAWAGSIEPHTGYMSVRASENFNISMRLSLEGIGAVLQNDYDYTVIRRVVKGGPADKEGQLKEGDRILGVKQQAEKEFTDIVGWPLDDVVDMIRGEKGTRVSLQVMDGDGGMEGAVKVVEIERDQVKLEDQAAQSRLIKLNQDDEQYKIGVIDLPAFYMDFAARSRNEPDFRSTTRDVRKLLEQLQAENVDGIIIDLRDNGGGSLVEVTELTGLFIDEGPVVQVKNSRGFVDVKEDPRPGTVYDGPLMVMVNRNSASASEIFAAAIQDYGRGLVVGERTFGKGTVQDLVNLDRYAGHDEPTLGRLRLTMAQFFRIDGGSTQLKGVEPDIDYGTLHNSTPIGERAFDNPLPWTKIQAAEFLSWQKSVGQYSEILSELHRKRASEDEAWESLMEDYGRYWAQRAETSVTLNESARQKEREAVDVRKEEREARYEKVRADLSIEIIDLSEQVLPSVPDSEMAMTEQTSETTDESDSDEPEAPDLLLRESARVLSDLLQLQAHPELAKAQKQAVN